MFTLVSPPLYVAFVSRCVYCMQRRYLEIWDVIGTSTILTSGVFPAISLGVIAESTNLQIDKYKIHYINLLFKSKQMCYHSYKTLLNNLNPLLPITVLLGLLKLGMGQDSLLIHRDPTLLRRGALRNLTQVQYHWNIQCQVNGKKMKTRILLVSVHKSLAECVKMLNPESCTHQRSIFCFRGCSKLVAFG